MNSHGKVPFRSHTAFWFFFRVILPGLILISISVPCFAEPALIAEPQDASTPPTIEEEDGFFESTLEKYGQNVDEFHAAITDTLNISADWLDSFFRDERMEIEENKNSLRAKMSIFIDEKEYDFRQKVRLRLVLPGFEEKFQLMVSSLYDDEEWLSKGASSTFDEDRIDDDNFSLSLRYFLKAAKKRNVSFNLGMSFDGLLPDPFAGSRFRWTRVLGEWTFRTTEQFTWFAVSGWEAKSDFDFERPLNEMVFFRTNVNGSWFEDENGFFYSLNNQLYQTIDADRALLYYWNTGFKTFPKNRLSQIGFGANYRTKFWREWLFFSVSPQIRFEDENNFEPITGIEFTIEGVFGNLRGRKI